MEAKKGGLETTLLDRCIELPKAMVLLNRQYRMNSEIMGFSNAWFYNNELIADETVAEHRLVNNENSSLYKCVEFIDTAGCSFDEAQNPETLSYSNHGEARILFQHLHQLLANYAQEGQPERISIGIISPYKEQREWLKEQLQEQAPALDVVSEISVKTIDGFQGEERDVIYISLVRSNEKGEIGFLSDLRRMNVAITRARKKLVVIGDSATIGSSEFYQTFLQYCEKHGLYRSAWHFAE
jgi:superfamily I DNA and/or RNA helicase